MAVENVKKFYEALSKDRNLQSKVNEQVSEAGGLSDVVVKVASANGYDISAADLEAFSKSNPPTKDRGLSDWDNCVCALAGGGVNMRDNCTCGCFLGGGGAKDRDNVMLVCAGAGVLGRV